METHDWLLDNVIANMHMHEKQEYFCAGSQGWQRKGMNISSMASNNGDSYIVRLFVETGISQTKIHPCKSIWYVLEQRK